LDNLLDIGAIIDGFLLVLDWRVIPIVLGGVFWGILFGAIPGFTGGLAMAVILPFTIPMPPLLALVLLLAVYTGSLWGGAVPAILLNTPGSPAAVCTTLDGYPMTRSGKAPEALSISIIASELGGMTGVLALFFVIYPLGAFTLKFGPAEMFMVAVFGITIVASLAGKNFAKGLLAGAIGMLIGLIGISTTGADRATFGVVEMLDGIPIIPALIGLIAISELFVLIEQKFIAGDSVGNDRPFQRVLAGCRTALCYPKVIIRSSLIGLGIGALPAAGGTVAGIVSYNESRRLSADPESFGRGNPVGIIAAEAANNASEGGSLATMLALGIPGSSGTAVLLGALILQGWIPGPRLFIDHADVIYGALLAEFLDLAVLMGLGIMIAVYGAKIIHIPTRILIPCVIVLTVMGSYMVRYVILDVWLLFAFGALGWLLKRRDYPTISVVLGLILGPLADGELVRIYQAFPEGIWIIFQRPISLGLVVLTVVLSLWPIYRRHLAAKKA
jgi:putative tricarboxylic transport membrane protein